MTVKKTFSRTTALIAGTAMLLINGVIYAWSIYSMPFGAGFGWSSAQLGACFTVMLASFCLVPAGAPHLAAVRLLRHLRHRRRLCV